MADLHEEIIAAMTELAGGEHPGFRVAHAKGVFCSGTFTPAPAASGLSRAAHLQDAPVEVTARFSNGGGKPDIKDAQRGEGRGLAVKFHLPDGAATDIVALTLPVFFVRDPESFLGLLHARKPDPGEKEPNMERLGAFLGEHPETAAALQLVIPTLVPPASFGTCVYNSLHAFALIDAAGERRYARYRFLPEAGEEQLPEAEYETASPNYLQEDVVSRLGGGTIAFTLVARVAEEGDPLEDPTLPWPEEREQVELGRLELTAVVPDAEARGITVFDPTNVVDGIETTDDEILQARSKAYSISAARRAAAPPGVAG